MGQRDRTNRKGVEKERDQDGGSNQRVRKEGKDGGLGQLDLYCQYPEKKARKNQVADIVK